MVLTDPAAAGAAARCLTARIRDPKRWITTDHPSRCGWCDYPRDVLARLVEAFNGRQDFDQRHLTATIEVEAFRRLDRDGQRAAVTAAQALEDEPPPAQTTTPEPFEAAPPPRAVVAVPEPPDWARRP